MDESRLIGANELYKLIEENSYTLVDRINSKDKGMFLIGIKEAIDKCPTVYNIDKVIEQLEWYLTGWVPIETIYKAIEIVKKGGAE